MQKLIYIHIIVLILSCSSSYNNQLSVLESEKQVLLVKDMMDTIFKKDVLLKSYLKFNKSDTIYIKADSILGVKKSWNSINKDGKYKILIVDSTNKHCFNFLELKILKNSIKVEMISKSTGHIVIGKAKLNENIWDLNEIKAGFR